MKLPPACAHNITHPIRVQAIVDCILNYTNTRNHSSSTSTTGLHTTNTGATCNDKNATCIDNPWNSKNDNTQLRKGLDKYKSHLLPDYVYISNIHINTSSLRPVNIQHGGIIIFANTVKHCQELHNELINNKTLAQCMNNVFGGNSSTAGSPLTNRIQCFTTMTRDPMAVIEQFKRNEIQILITTDLICRGVDITHVQLVIQAEFAENVVNYIVSTLYVYMCARAVLIY